MIVRGKLGGIRISPISFFAFVFSLIAGFGKKRLANLSIL